MEPLRIHLFGGFLLERGGTALAPIASRAGRSLFARLVMERGKPLQREYLAGIFWPELPEGRARRRLSHTLWQIQDVISEGSDSHLAVTVDTLAFDATTPYWLDVDEFDSVFDGLGLARASAPLGRTADLAALRRCVELYRGDFLAGFFDEWVVVEQELYRERYRVALGRLVEATKAHGAYEEALTHARRLTHHDPLREEAHQEVMRLCFLLGRVNEAVQQFERCRSILAEALGAEPSGPTVELYRRIVRRRGATVPTAETTREDLLGSPIDVPFVGRLEERRQMLDLFERVLGGAGGVVLVEGEPGVGKSRLVLEALEDARWRGFEVIWGACRPGTLRPFAPIVEVLGSISPLRAGQLAERASPGWLGAALRLAPRLMDSPAGAQPSAATPATPPVDPSGMHDGLAATLAALGRIAPHVVIVDDVHWADRDTLKVLTRLGPRLASTRVLLVLLYRSEEGRGEPEIWDSLRELDRIAGLGRIVLSPMSVFELAELARRLLDVPSVEPGIASGLHRRTGGNALFTLETLLSIRDRAEREGLTDTVGTLAEQLTMQTVPIAERVRSVIHSRIGLLDDEAASVLEACAVSGDGAGIGILAAATDLARSTVMDAVADLLHRRLLGDTDGHYHITHDHIRQVVYEELDPDARRQLHLRFAETLAGSEKHDVEALAYHFSRAGEIGRAIDFHRLAGLRSERLGAFETAAQHLEAARSLAAEGSHPVDGRYRLLGELERVLDVLGRRTRQASVIEEMAMLGVPGTAADLDRRRARLLANTGEFEEAEEAATRSVRAERRGEGSGLAASLVMLGTCIRWSGRPLDAIGPLRAALDAEGDDGQRAEALAELGSTLVEVQDSSEALPHLAEAGDLFRRVGNPRGEAEVLGIQARAFRQLGQSDEATTLYEDALELCTRIGYRHGEGVNLVNLGTLRYLQGQPVEALDAYDRAAVVFGEMGDQRGQAMVLANASSVRHRLLGDDERALIEARQAMAYFASIGDRAREAQCTEVVAGVAAREGDLGSAVAMLEGSIEILQGAGNRYLMGQHLRSLALLYLSENRPQDALETLDRAERVCAEAGLADLAVELVSIRGAALLAVGAVGEAVATTRLAVEQLAPGVEAAHLVHHRYSVAAESAGLVAEARGAAADAVRLLERALSGLSPAARSTALERVPEHRDIMEVWRRLGPRTIEVTLPASDAPSGKSLGGRDLREVRWTVHHPDDERIAGRIPRRRRRLLRLIREADEQGATPAIADLASALDVSPSTIGRDLNWLRETGHDVATRGSDHRAS